MQYFHVVFIGVYSSSECTQRDRVVYVVKLHALANVTKSQLSRVARQEKVNT
jgi:hypothetical protein